MASVVSDLVVGRQFADRWNVAARRFAYALRASDGGQAKSEALEAHRSGLSIPGVHVRVITPAMYWIGELWMRGAITPADEHVATAICHRVLASLHASDRSRRGNARKTVVVAAPAGEHHALGPRMVADVLELAGFTVIYLGTDVPVGALTTAVAEHEPDVVCLSLTMAVGGSKLEQAVAAIGQTRPATPVLLGGQGVPQVLIESGIPYLANLEHLVTEVGRLADVDSRPVALLHRSGRRGLDRASRARASEIGSPESQMFDVTIDMDRLVREQARLTTRLRALAFEDYLTGLPNRRAFDDQFADITRGDSPPRLVLLLLDLDRLKQINDRFGHDEGDRALCMVGDALSRCMRAGDFPARLGGDEFAALIVAIDPGEARTLAERLQRAVSDVSGSLELTISVGIALFDGDRRRTMRKADTALDGAKEAGRSTICMSNPSAGPTGSTDPSIEDVTFAFSAAAQALEEVRLVAETFLDDSPAHLGKRPVSALESAAASRARLEEILSPREIEVLGIVSDGDSNAEIAARLVIAETTVETHVGNIMRKLGARNRTEASGHFLRH